MDITDGMRLAYRMKMLWLADRRPPYDWAVPIAMHVDAKQVQREELDKLVAEGLLVEDKQRVDRDGHPNPRGKSWRTIWRRVRKSPTATA